MKMQFFLALILLASATGATAVAEDALTAGFAAPPDSAKPWVYWFWLDGNITREGITATFTVTADWAAFAEIWGDVEGGDGGTPYITVEVTPNLQAAPIAIDGKYSLSLAVASARALDVRQIGTSYVWEVDLPIDGSDHTITVTPTLAMIDDDGGFAGAWERGFESGEDYRGSYVIYVPELTIDQEVKFLAD